MLRVMRHGDRHDPREVTIGVRFDGHGEGMVPGETVKNLVHRVARGQAHPTVEDLGLAIAGRIHEQYPAVGTVRVDVAERPWLRVVAGGKPQGQAFMPSSGERRTAAVIAEASGSM